MSDTAVQDATADLLSLGISWQTVAKLAEPTPPNEVQTRPDRATWQHKESCPGRGCQSQRDPAAHVQLSYVDARFVMRRLDAVCGPYWQRDHKPALAGTVSAGIGILIDGQWIWRWDGAGPTDIEGEKGAYSDSFKRAAVSWGIARDLYGDVPANVPVNAPQTPVPQASPVERPPLPPNTVPYQDAQAAEPGNCPVHNTPWRTTKGDGSPAKRAYCSGKQPNGDYCDQRGPWLNK